MTVELEFLGKQMERVLNEIGSLREDMTVMMEIMRRVERNLNSLNSQLTDMHVYNRRVEARVAKLEADA
jgi:DNA anti-recombination protein RmuC